MQLSPDGLGKHDQLEKIHAGSGCCGLQPDHLRWVRLPAGGRRRTGVFPGLLLLNKEPELLQLWLNKKNKGLLCVYMRINAQLSFGNSSSCSGDAYIQHGSRAEQTTLKRHDRGVLVSANSVTIHSNVDNMVKLVNTYTQKDKIKYQFWNCAECVF